MDNQYSFKNFVKDEGNQLALTVADTVTNNLTAINPLTIYGPSGSGKTHLLIAMANKLKGQHKEVFYVTGRTFRQQITKVFETDPPFQYISVDETSLRLEAFRESFAADAAVVIFDEMETLTDIPCTAAELARIARTLLEKGKQLVFSFCSVPEDIFPSYHPLILLVRSDSGMVLEIRGPEEDRIDTNHRNEVI